MPKVMVKVLPSPMMEEETAEEMIARSDLLLVFGGKEGAPFAEEYAQKKKIPVEYREIIKKPDLK